MREHVQVVVVRWARRAAVGLLAVTLVLSISTSGGASVRTSPAPGVVAVRIGPYGSDVGGSDLMLQPDGEVVAAASFSYGFHAHSFGLAWVDGVGRVARVATWPFDTPLSYASPSAAAVAPDSGIVVAGTADAYVNGLVGGFLVRFHPDGSVDRSFGTDGIVLQRHGRSGITDMVIQPDGRILTVGWISSDDGVRSFCISRYGARGVPDPTFGSGSEALCRDDIAATALALQPDGKIVVAGGGALARYTSDGSLDQSFGSNGTATHRELYPSDVAVQPNGRIVVAGRYLFRYLPDGSPDPSFGDNGRTAAGASSSWSQIAVQPDGKIDAVGFREGGHGMLARYLPDGSPDSSFGTGGVTESAGFEYSLVLQSDGKIVVGGTDAASTATQPRSLTLARYLSGGRPDATFGAYCVVPRVVGVQLPGAKSAIAKAFCRTGSISSRYSTARKGRVISQSPKAGTYLPAKGRVSLVVSRGPKTR